VAICSGGSEGVAGAQACLAAGRFPSAAAGAGLAAAFERQNEVHAAAVGEPGLGERLRVLEVVAAEDEPLLLGRDALLLGNVLLHLVHAALRRNSNLDLAAGESHNNQLHRVRRGWIAGGDQHRAPYPTKQMESGTVPGRIGSGYSRARFVMDMELIPATVLTQGELVLLKTIMTILLAVIVYAIYTSVKRLSFA